MSKLKELKVEKCLWNIYYAASPAAPSLTRLSQIGPSLSPGLQQRVDSPSDLVTCEPTLLYTMSPLCLLLSQPSSQSWPVIAVILWGLLGG